MMTIVDILLLSVALAMDCFTVSIVSGVIVRRPISRAVVRMALLFGLFQAAMPLIGWLSTTYFSQYLESVDHWIAFLLLMFVGGRMVKESFAEEDSEPTFNPLLAVATSIDALAIGISMACLGYNRLSQLALPLVLIGVTSLLLSVAGYWLGVRFGRVAARRLRPELIGGLVLMFIGIKVLVSHLFA